MKVFLAGTERIESDVCRIGGGNMQLYLAGAEVIDGYIRNGKAERDIMNMHLAESGGAMNAYITEGLYSDANVLQSFYYASDFTTNVIIPNCKSFMLDSGAFSFMKGKSIANWDAYIDKYADFIVRNGIRLYFELDIDSIVGLDAVINIRKRLYEKTGVKPIPVWHKARGLESFKKDCSEYPYVAIGGIVTQEIKRQEYPIFEKLINIAHASGAKIHGLGFTNLDGLTKYHFDSVDSTAWVSGNRFGAIYFFDGKTMKKVNKPQGKKVKTNLTAIHNFTEWKKFARYAEAKL